MALETLTQEEHALTDKWDGAGNPPVGAVVWVTPRRVIPVMDEPGDYLCKVIGLHAVGRGGFIWLDLVRDDGEVVGSPVSMMVHDAGYLPFKALPAEGTAYGLLAYNEHQPVGGWEAYTSTHHLLPQAEAAAKELLKTWACVDVVETATKRIIHEWQQ